ncbi:ATP-dependent RNA helicase DBP10 [Plasmodium gonderi]|uniref:ATP-dependent RNA helicase DBP10 n=1 Tax=Plasmodium gonderi TaxID=77519 RepID=A0A1Y1JAW7_PLAGO|nr:ATP-dependent RNA helicase DBP10 [Plasmodium gonderi]GAW79636.1 ATP-dependent RNA helicase DBP10 [Plasmodium gonderi]
MKNKKMRKKGNTNHMMKSNISNKGKKIRKGKNEKIGILKKKMQSNEGRLKRTGKNDAIKKKEKTNRSTNNNRYSWLFNKEKMKEEKKINKDTYTTVGRIGNSSIEYRKKKKTSHSDENESEEEEGTTDYKRKRKKFVLYKKKKGKKKNIKQKGMLICFHNLGLSEKMCRSISSNLKYNRPTDIQKLCIPKILNRKDIICISKTGTGKSLVYVSTLIDILSEHSKYFGIRGLVLVPTKELAIQIYKLAKKICKNFFNLKINVIIGGISLTKQFDMLKENLDILICTPGRLSFILVETKLSLEKVEILIIDEADRLLELNYFNDMNIIYKYLHRSCKQTLLISATLPTDIQNYFKLKLKNPDILSLSSDNSISDKLNLHFLFTRSYEKYGLLIKLILLFQKKNLGKTLIFFCTKYHILFFSKILTHLKIQHTILYGNSDTSFRLEQIKKFTQNENIQFLLVTDVAARGINITSVQNVINYSLPFSPKLFIHRIGRACRDDNTPHGFAISLVTYQDIIYAYEICFFIGKKLKFFRDPDLVSALMNSQSGGVPVHADPEGQRVDAEKKKDVTDAEKKKDVTDAEKKKDVTDAEKKKDVTDVGKHPRNVVYIGSVNNISDCVELVDKLKNADDELISLNKSILASYKLYYAMRPKVSKYASTKCVKKINKIGGIYKLCLFCHPHEIYQEERSSLMEEEEEKEERGLHIQSKVEQSNEKKLKQVDELFDTLTFTLKRNVGEEDPKGKKPTTEALIESEVIDMDDKFHNVEEGNVSKLTISQMEERNESEHIEKVKIKNYTQNEVMTFIHNFQNNEKGKTKSISEEIKEKLNRLKVKMHRNKISKNGNTSKDINELMDALAMGITDHEDDNEFLKNKNQKNTNDGEDDENNQNNEKINKKQKKMSKRALKKKKREEKENGNMKESIKKNSLYDTSGERWAKEDTPLDDILKKINERKKKRETCSVFAIKTPGFDLPPDEEEELNKHRFIKKKVWDMRKKKFILKEIDTLQEDGFKKKNSRNGEISGRSTREVGAQEEGRKGLGGRWNQPISSIYHKWVKRTKNRIKNVGELEDENDQTDFRKKKQSSRFISEKTRKRDMDDEKQTHLQMLQQNHPEITDSLSKNTKLTKKQQRLYKKYLTGRYIESDPNSNLHKNHPQVQKEKAKMLQKKLRTDKNFRMRYVRIKKKQHVQKLREKENLKSARARSLVIVKKKKISK